MATTLDPRRKVVEDRPAEPNVPKRGTPRAVAVMESLVIPRGFGAHKRLSVRPWQRKIVDEVFGKRRKVVVATMPRANGKTTLAGAMALYAATFDEVPSPSVALVATNEDQARRLLAVCTRFVKRSPHLAERCTVYSDRLVFNCWESEICAYPAKATALLGLDFNLAILDEIGAMEPSVWESVVTAQGKRPDSTVFGIGSRVPGENDLLESLIDMESEVDAKHFKLLNWQAKPGCRIDNEKEWARANPALGDFLDVEAMRMLVKTTPEPSFRSYRLNQRADALGSWIARTAWDACALPKATIQPGDDVCLGFDGSMSGDASAIAVASMERHLIAPHVWQGDHRKGYRVPRSEVDATVEALFNTYNVQRMLCDPFAWSSEIEAWSKRYGADRVLTYPCNSYARWGPACDRFFQHVAEKTLTHPDDWTLNKHIVACVGKPTSNGTLPVKAHQGAKIDAAVASTLAIEAVHQVLSAPAAKSRRVLTFA